jgi:CRISPR system Cascade subunit CasE
LHYLSRLLIDLRRHDVQADIADCHWLHTRLMAALPAVSSPSNAREEFGMLFRVEPFGDAPLARVLVQSNRPPDWTTLPAGYLGPVPDARQPRGAHAR